MESGLAFIERRIIDSHFVDQADVLNIGAAAAPLLAGGADRRAMVMVALAVPTTIAGAALASRWLSRRDGGRGRP